jgi:adenylate cyclase, class 2
MLLLYRTYAPYGRENTVKYEVEMKFPVADLTAVEARLALIGAKLSAAEAEPDTYFAHPARDFAQTDEALRLRRRRDAYFITYKGPKIDTTTKTRHEIDLPLATGETNFPAWRSLLENLGFTAVAEVRKSRRKAHLAWRGQNVEISLDEVEQVGSFVEMEIVVEQQRAEAVAVKRPNRPRAEATSRAPFSVVKDDSPRPAPLADPSDQSSSPPSSVDAARECLVALAGELGLTGSERRSYLELLLAKSHR